MKEDEIIEVLDRRIKKVKKEYHRLHESYDEESVHDYRSEMKKLKAFIRLLNINRSRGEKIRIGKKMKNVYRLSGNIRNLQLHLQRIKDIAGKRGLDYPENYITLLDEERTDDLAHLQSATKKLSFHQFSKNIFDSKPFKLDQDDCERYLVQQVNILRLVLSAPSVSDEALHESRRILKDIGYNRRYLSEAMPPTISVFISDEEQTDNATDKLGTFHDLCVSLAFLEPDYTTQVENPAEQTTLDEIKTDISESHLKLKDELVQLLALTKG